MAAPMNKDDELFCQWLHNAIPRNDLAVLTLFNNDAFGRDSYLELRYRPEDAIANLYFCGNGIDKVRQDHFLYTVTQNHEVPHYTNRLEFLDQSNPLCYLDSVRIRGEKLSYIFEILYECHGMHVDQTASGRDGNFVTLKIFWPVTAEFCYWVSPQNITFRIRELVWLLANTLPRPARDSLQSCLTPEETRQLQKKLQFNCAVANDLPSGLQDLIQKGASHAEN